MSKSLSMNDFYDEVKIKKEREAAVQNLIWSQKARPGETDELLEAARWLNSPECSTAIVRNGVKMWAGADRVIVNPDDSPEASREEIMKAFVEETRERAEAGGWEQIRFSGDEESAALFKKMVQESDPAFKIPIEISSPEGKERIEPQGASEEIEIEEEIEEDSGPGM